jgi:hypothetical protein
MAEYLFLQLLFVHLLDSKLLSIEIAELYCSKATLTQCFFNSVLINHYTTFILKLAEACSTNDW